MRSVMVFSTAFLLRTNYSDWQFMCFNFFNITKYNMIYFVKHKSENHSSFSPIINIEASQYCKEARSTS